MMGPRCAKDCVRYMVALKIKIKIKLTESELGSGLGLLEKIPPLLPLSESGSLPRLDSELVDNVRFGGGLSLIIPSAPGLSTWSFNTGRCEGEGPVMVVVDDRRECDPTVGVGVTQLVDRSLSSSSSDPSLRWESRAAATPDRVAPVYPVELLTSQGNGLGLRLLASSTRCDIEFDSALFNEPNVHLGLEAEGIRGLDEDKGGEAGGGDCAREEVLYTGDDVEAVNTCSIPREALCGFGATMRS
jgi:hypothetical protein